MCSTLFACRHSRPMASLSSDLVQQSPWSAGHRATPCPGCPGPDWWDFEDNNYDMSKWSGPWWSPWRMIRTVMIILENYWWRVFDSELHDAVGGEKQSWELSCRWAGFQIGNIAMIFRTLLKYCEYPDYVVHIVIIFWTQFQYCEYCEFHPGSYLLTF